MDKAKYNQVLYQIKCYYVFVPHTYATQIIIDDYIKSSLKIEKRVKQVGSPLLVSVPIS